MMSSQENTDRGGPETGTSRPPSPERQRQRRRIWRTTRALAAGGVAATAAFVFASAHGGRGGEAVTDSTQSQADETGAVVPLPSNDDSGDLSDDDGSSWSITPSQTAPTPSYSAPVTHSGSS
jgi:hypothetical protein